MFLKCSVNIPKIFRNEVAKSYFFYMSSGEERKKVKKVYKTIKNGLQKYDIVEMNKVVEHMERNGRMLMQFKQLRELEAIPSEGDKLVEARGMKELMSHYLNDYSVTIMNSAGEYVEAPIKDQLVMATLKDAMEKPSTKKLKDIMEITGELKVVEQVQHRDGLFDGITIEEKTSGTN